MKKLKFNYSERYCIKNYILKIDMIAVQECGKKLYLNVSREAV